jgi:hypothetical protein
MSKEGVRGRMCERVCEDVRGKMCERMCEGARENV